LFSTETIERSQNELVIALVPHIVRTQEITPVNLRGIFVGNDQTAKLNYARTGGDVAAAPPAAAPAATTPTVIDTPAPAKAQLPPAAPVRLTFQPEGVVTRSGSEVVVTLHVAEAVDLFQAPVRFKYDPKKLKLQNVTPGVFLSSDGQRVTSSHDDNAAKGEIAVQLSRVAGAPGLTGNGALLSLRFMTIAAGDTTVAVLDSALQNAKLQTVPAQSPSVGVEIR
jgi:general secretion pathway protein D